MKPWEEEWDPDDIINIAAKVAYNPGRRQLASAAPDMARALLAVEWKGHPLPQIADSEWRSCVSCGKTYPTHRDDCVLDAALRKAGVR